ncbi:MAG TPA: ACP S-malonyltransferase [Clostridia bacterium]|nr:ACP S-malonyltransferase [Clostridia bacterium]
MGKIGFLFSGQGSQYIGMGKDLIEKYKSSKDIFDEADEALEMDLTKMVTEGNQDELNLTENTQPAVLTTSMAALKAAEEKGLKPDVVAGLSLGEYTALVAAGALAFAAAVKLVKKRGRYMQDAVPQGKGTMAAIIGLDEEKVQEAVDEAKQYGIVECANFNCPGQIVIGGEIEAVEKASALAKEKGAKLVAPLKVSAPFHTSMLRPAADKLAEELKSINFEDLNIPIVSNVFAEYIEHKDHIKDILKNQVMKPVQWEKSIQRMVNDGVDTFVEIGPGKTLSGFIKKIGRKEKVKLRIINIEDVKSLEKAVETLSPKANVTIESINRLTTKKKGKIGDKAC